MIKKLAQSTAGKAGTVIVGGSLGAYGVSKLVSSSDKNNTNNKVLTKAKENTNTNSSLELASRTVSNPVSSKKSTQFLFNTEGFGEDSNEYSKNKHSFGYAFGRFMFNPNDETLNWEKPKQALDNHIKIGTIFSDDFQKVKSGKEDIKEVCSSVYKKLKTDVLGDDKLKAEVWNYCAALWVPPKFISEKTAKDNYSGKWAGEGGNDVILLWAEDYEDTWERIENILKEDLKDPEKKKNIHPSLYSINSTEELMNFCKTAYNSAPTNEETVYGKSAREYCALDMSLELDGYPTEPVAE